MASLTNLSVVIMTMVLVVGCDTNDQTSNSNDKTKTQAQNIHYTVKQGVIGGTDDTAKAIVETTTDPVISTGLMISSSTATTQFAGAASTEPASETVNRSLKRSIGLSEQ